MATPLLARTIRAVINGHRGLDRRANVLHFQVPGTAVTPALVDAVAADVAQWVTQLYAPMCSNTIIFDDVTATDASVSNGYQKQIPLTAITGAKGSNAVPGNACAVVSLHTAQGGRSGRGRVYLFETYIDDMQNDETWRQQYVTAIQQAWNLLQTPTNGDPGYSLAVGSRKGLCSFDVTSVKAHNYIGNQKDRLPGHRRHKKKHTVTP